MDNFALPEGPLWVGGPNGYLLVCDVNGNAIRRWSKKEGEKTWLNPSGYAGPPTKIVRQYGPGGLILARGGIVSADVGAQAIDHRPALLARATVALLDGHVLAGFGLPVLGKRGVEFHVQLAGRVVRHVEQRGLGRSHGNGGQSDGTE